MRKVIVIAEAGVNHNGDINIAKQLVDVAADAGADYVKFQTFKAEKIVSPTARKAEYQRQFELEQEQEEKSELEFELEQEQNRDDSQFNMLKKLELSEADHYELIDYCKQKNINFFSTAFDVDGLDFLLSLKLQLFKVPSGEITNYPYLKKIAGFGKPVILSTGMSDLEDIRAAVNVLLSDSLKREDLTILHCNTEYPTPMKDVNLMAMHHIEREFGVKIGYSDHTRGIEVPIAATALGATVIEKHFTLDRSLPGPDHAASLEPDELKAMVSAIRNIAEATDGSGRKEVSDSERKNIDIARKSIHLSRDVQKGEKITEDVLIALRPGTGISPMKWEEVLGKTFATDLKKDTLLKWEDIQ